MILMSFPLLVHFTYELSQCSGNDLQQLNNFIGFLTSTWHSMMLRLMPPNSGTYELILFARPGSTSKTFDWICSFQLECPSPKTSEELPENLYMCWGLQPDMMSLGLKPFNYGNGIILLDSGSFSNSNQPFKPRPHHSQWEQSITISINLPESGVYKLGLYGKTSIKQEFTYLCDYILKNASVNKWPPFPSMYNTWKKGSVLFEPHAGQL
ncbi:hypothetical protein cypCar_00037635 [Cyprinus carpio]|nr:hypothetical protein cypCar_00037635 [Cyprinus carpio]